MQTEVVQRVAADPFERSSAVAPGTQTSAGLGSGFIIRAGRRDRHERARRRRRDDDLRHAARRHDVSRHGRSARTRRTISPCSRSNAKDLPVAPLGDSDNLLIGEWAIAIGNPYGFMLGNSEPSVTAGVISGVGRNLVARGEGPSAYFDMIQTDASINPGNSGGPLVSATGEVIGVNTSIYSTTAAAPSASASPFRSIARVASTEDLLAHGRVRRPWIGVQLEQPRTDNPRDLIARGATVAGVAPGSPARAGRHSAPAT